MVSYRFSNNWSLQLNGNADSKLSTFQSYRLLVYGMDVVVGKLLMNNWINLVIVVNDVFNSRRYQSVFEGENLIKITMSYRGLFITIPSQ